MIKQPVALEPAIIVIFGMTGDLSRKYLLPALYHLFKDNLLNEKTQIVGTSRKKLSVDELLKDVELCVRETDNICDPKVVKAMRSRMRLITMDLSEGDDYQRLLHELNAIEDTAGVCMNRLYYLSIPPQIYAPIVRNLGEQRLNKSCQHGVAETRLLVEKPFGYDVQSAEDLIQETAKQFKEEQVFRIDHYLAKETAQNILTFRRHNPIFSSVWNRQYVRSIKIIAYEKIGVAKRAEFYDNVGALRDWVQSHLLQLLALTTMELPKDTSVQAIHTARLKLLKDVLPVPADKVRERTKRAQYHGYRAEVQNAHSITETYVSLKLEIDNDRWRGVPIEITTGKALNERRTEVTLEFNDDTKTDDSNVLTFRILPNEGIDIGLQVKKPGFDHALERAMMDFSYQRTFQTGAHPDAYERVLVDAVRGDHTLFATSDEVLMSWRIIQPILNEWAKDSRDLLAYKTNSTGPAI